MKAVPVSDALGVELQDFDIKQPCGREEQATLRRLFCEHHLLLVRGQELADEDQTRFMGYFGPLHEMAGNAAIYVSNREGKPTGAGTGREPGRLLRHSDGVYGPRPGIATSLWAQEVWPDSAPTSFANAARALELLPEDLRQRVHGLHAVFLRDLYVERTDHRWREEDISPTETDRWTRIEHPVVWQLPHDPAQKVLLVNELATSHIVGLSRDESEALLQDLFSFTYADDNVYTHQWQTDDLVIWDNQALQHCRPEMGSTPRHLRRQSLNGWFNDDGLLEWEESAYGPANAGGKLSRRVKTSARNRRLLADMN